MSLAGPYVHRIDPIIGSLFGAHLWWYGLSYAVGFLAIFLQLRRHRQHLGLSTRNVYDFTILVSLGGLVGGRLVQVLCYEWPFYSQHPRLIPAVWLGGMATHGVLLGAAAGVLLFALVRRMSFCELTDTLAAPAAVILALARIGNFIDGQSVGSLTDVWWAVKFPDAEGLRHPVVLYDGAKNLLLVPLLLAAGRQRLRPGMATGLFFFLYAFPQIFIDFFRESPATLLAVVAGQAGNLGLLALGLHLLWRHPPRPAESSPDAAPGWLVKASLHPVRLGWRRAVLAGLLLVALVLPSDWTQDIPVRYGLRHPGLRHSSVYPPVDHYRAGMRQQERSMDRSRAGSAS